MLAQRRHLLGEHTTFAPLPRRGVDLNAHAERRLARRVHRGDRILQLVGQLLAINRLDDREARHAVHEWLRLVALQLANVTPPHVGRHLGCLADKLLHVILAKIALARVVRRFQKFHRLRLRDGDEPRRAVASSAISCRFDGRANLC